VIHRTFLALSFGAATLISLAHAARDARAQSASPPPPSIDSVVTRREPPFDYWCLARLCPGQAQERPSPLKLPATIAPNVAQGLLEQKLKGALSDALETAARAALGPEYNEAVADLSEAIAATAAGDPDRLATLGGLGASAMRVALVYHLDTLVPGDAACVGPRRIDAIYEGLGVTVTLAPLRFPKKRGATSAACAETAKKAAIAVDGAVLVAITSPEVRRAVVSIEQALDDARKNCGSLTGTTDDTLARVRAASDTFSATRVGAVAHALRALGAATPTTAAPGTPPQPSAAEQACTKSLDTLRAADPATFEALAGAALADVAIAPLAVLFAGSQDAGTALVVRVATGTATRDDMVSLVGALAKAAALPVGAPVLGDALGALPNAVVVQDGAPTVDPNALLAFLADKYDVGDDGKPSLRSLLDLQPTPWVFELNGGLPNVDFSQQKVVADVSIGYATKSIGVVGRGAVDTYNLADSQVHDDYTHAGGSLEAWWLSGELTRSLRLEIRLAGGFDYYDTTSYPRQDALSNFYDFDSRVGRGTAFVGLRYGAPLDRVSLQLLLGGGGQYEDPDTTRFTSGNTFSLNSQANFSGQASGRLLVRVRIVPQIIGARLRAETIYFDLTREALSYVNSGGVQTTTSSVEVQQQLEVHSRLFLDADIASFAGFVPAVFGGLDYLGIQGSSTSTSALIPVLGVGIVRTTW